MIEFVAARRRKRLVAKLNRAWWRTTIRSMKLIARHENDEPWYGLSEDLYEILRAVGAGEPIDAPFPADPWPPPSPVDVMLAALRASTRSPGS